MARLSRTWWRFVCPRLWKEVDGVQHLLALVLGENHFWVHDPRRSRDRISLLKDVSAGSAGDGDEGGIAETSSKMPNTVRTSQFLRFQAYAPFVNTLVLGRCFITRGVLHFLIRQKAEGPLLPNLHILLVEKEQVGGRDPGWGSLLRTLPNDIEDLAALFLSPKLETLAISCNYFAISPNKVTSQCPQIKDIRLAYAGKNVPKLHYGITFRHRMGVGYNPSLDQTNPGVEIEAEWGVWPRRFLEAMSCWPALSKLTINGSFLNAVTLDLLCQLCALEHLTIEELQEDTDWESLASPNAKFPHLFDLRLYNSPLSAASRLFGCVSLLQNVLRLSWDVLLSEGSLGRSHRHYIKALSHLSSNAPHLQALIMYSHHLLSSAPFWEDAEAAMLLSSLGLLELYLWSRHYLADSEMTCATAFMGFGPQLRTLCMSNISIPIHALPQIAQAYPQLSRLYIELNVVDLETNPCTNVPKTALDRPMELVAKFARNGWPKLDEASEARALQNLARYIRTIWRHLTFKPGFRSDPSKKEVQLLEGLKSALNSDTREMP